jgi:hypothetical protein
MCGCLIVRQEDGKDDDYDNDYYDSDGKVTTTCKHDPTISPDEEDNDDDSDGKVTSTSNHNPQHRGGGWRRCTSIR